jgi:hydroxymethylglutaryl-CoA lyase
VVTEDLVQLLQVLGNDTGIDLAKLIEVAHQVKALIRQPLDGRVHQAGGLYPLFDENLPVVFTRDEAQHFRLGAGVCQSDFRPWLRSRG